MISVRAHFSRTLGGGRDKMRRGSVRTISSETLHIDSMMTSKDAATAEC